MYYFAYGKSLLTIAVKLTFLFDLKQSLFRVLSTRMKLLDIAPGGNSLWTKFLCLRDLYMSLTLCPRS